MIISAAAAREAAVRGAAAMAVGMMVAVLTWVGMTAVMAVMAVMAASAAAWAARAEA